MATMEAKRLSITIFKVLRECNYQYRIVNPAKVSLQNESKMKKFSDEQKLREFTTNRHSLKELLKYVLYEQERGSYICFT